MEKVIEIKNLSKAYERYVVDGNNSSKKVRKLEYVLKDINLDIYKSDVVGIIGPNGSGKSTLLKILSGITAPTEGEVLIIGKVASILELGVGFDMELSGYDNIFYGGRLLGFSNREIRQSIDKIIEFSGLEDYIYTPVKFYSSGMVMRLAYSLVTNVNSDILLFDEIMAVGDIDFSQKVIEEVMNKIKNKKTILFVTHDINFIPLICNKVIVLGDSTVKYSGTVYEGISTYKNAYFKMHLDDIVKTDMLKKSSAVDQQAFVGFENSFCRLSDVYIEESNITSLDDFMIVFKIGILVEEIRVNIGIILNSVIDKNSLLTSAMEWSGLHQLNCVGEFEVKCTIPRKFLNSG
ncbi:MAG TPA: ATP-binding cassette domain-containing protein, partial [Bacteroidales bacterium]|nr:ATP-binding cassette domain-containing protein [Bacteroidales bacterium]